MNGHRLPPLERWADARPLPSAQLQPRHALSLPRSPPELRNTSSREAHFTLPPPATPIEQNAKEEALQSQSAPGLNQNLSIRRERNRMAARKSRAAKRSRAEGLKNHVEDIDKEIQRLRNAIQRTRQEATRGVQPNHQRECIDIATERAVSVLLRRFLQYDHGVLLGDGDSIRSFALRRKRFNQQSLGRLQRVVEIDYPCGTVRAIHDRLTDSDFSSTTVVPEPAVGSPIWKYFTRQDAAQVTKAASEAVRTMPVCVRVPYRRPRRAAADGNTSDFRNHSDALCEAWIVAVERQGRDEQRLLVAETSQVQINSLV